MNSIHVKHKDVNWFISCSNETTFDKLQSLTVLETFGEAISLIYPFVADEDHDEDLDLKIVDLHLNEKEVLTLEMMSYSLI